MPTWSLRRPLARAAPTAPAADHAVYCIAQEARDSRPTNTPQAPGLPPSSGNERMRWCGGRERPYLSKRRALAGVGERRLGPTGPPRSGLQPTGGMGGRGPTANGGLLAGVAWPPYALPEWAAPQAPQAGRHMETSLCRSHDDFGSRTPADSSSGMVPGHSHRKPVSPG